MIKASALYIVLIVSLMIAIISGSLISVAYYYKIENLKKVRYDKLHDNLASGISILLSSMDQPADTLQHVDLYDNSHDSVDLRQSTWGIYQLNMLQAYEQGDTLKSVFLSGSRYSDPNAIYLADEDRPLSVSGDTKIVGDGELPKSGLKQSYVDGKAYQGKELIYGKITNSGSDMPAISERLLKAIQERLHFKDGVKFDVRDSVVNTFYGETLHYRMAAGQLELPPVKLKGKVVIYSDTTVILSEGLELEDVQIYASSIIIPDKFKGSCQLFARDSIVIGKKCRFDYPSFAGVFREEGSKGQPVIKVGEGSVFTGILLSYEKSRSELQTMIALGKESLIKGEVFAAGIVKLESPVKIQGKVSAKRFLMQRSGTLYENYLIDIGIDRRVLSPYYLSSVLFERKEKAKEVLKWLN